MTTLQDIADRVGVTRIVVSRVLNNRVGKIGVSEEKRLLILKVAKELNYTPNRTARALTTRKNKALGLIVHQRRFEMPTGEDGASIFNLLAGMHLICDPLDYRCLYTCADMRNEVTFEMPKFLLERSVDAVIVHGYLNHAVEKKLLATGLPMGHIGFNIDQDSRMPCVSSNMVAAACDLLDKAREKGLGHVHLYAGGGPGSRKIIEAFLEHGRLLCPGMLVTAAASSAVTPEYEECRRHGYKLATHATPPDLILCSISFYHPLMVGFQESGKVCPSDVDMVAFAPEGRQQQRYLGTDLNISQIILPFTSISQELTRRLIDVLEERVATVESSLQDCHVFPGETAPSLFSDGVMHS